MRTAWTASFWLCAYSWGNECAFRAISNRLAQGDFCDGFGADKPISNRFCITNRIGCNPLKTNDRDISNRV